MVVTAGDILYYIVMILQERPLHQKLNNQWMRLDNTLIVATYYIAYG